MLEQLIKSRSALRKRLLKPFIFKTNPNYITILALVMAVAAGVLFYYKLFFVAALAVLANGFFDILDGEIAKKYGTTARGDFLDHTCDRLADTAILLGITLSGRIPVLLGFSTVIVTLLVSYLGTASQALTKKRLYTALVGRADRILLIAVSALLALVWQPALYWGILILLALSAATFVQRFSIIWRAL